MTKRRKTRKIGSHNHFFEQKKHANTQPTPKKIMNYSILSGDMVRKIDSNLNFEDFKNFRSTCSFFAKETFGNLINRIQEHYTIQQCAADMHSLFLMKDGKVLACGANEFGWLGLGHNHNSSNPVLVPNLDDISFVAAGMAHSLFLKKDGQVYVCGSNYKGQLGLPDYINNQPTPYWFSSPLLIPHFNQVERVFVGGHCSIFCKKDGTVWACGNNEDGQLGLGDTQNRMIPTLIPSLKDVCQVSFGSQHTVFLKKDGTVWVCGRILSGRYLDTVLVSQPAQILNLCNVCQIVAGWDHTIFLKKDGTVLSCGWNGWGKLGVGDWNSRYKPTLIPHFDEIIQIAGGERHVLYLKKDGTVWASGDGRCGQLGIMKESCIPIQIPKLDNVKMIIAGRYHSLFFKADGSILACGLNKEGALGLGHFAEQVNLPTQISLIRPHQNKGLPRVLNELDRSHQAFEKRFNNK